MTWERDVCAFRDGGLHQQHRKKRQYISPVFPFIRTNSFPPNQQIYTTALAIRAPHTSILLFKGFKPRCDLKKRNRRNLEAHQFVTVHNAQHTSKTAVFFEKVKVKTNFLASVFKSSIDHGRARRSSNFCF